MTHRKSLLALLLLFTLTVTAACSTGSLFATGVSLEATGDQFVATTEQVTAGCASKVIDAAACAKYRAFGEHFKRVYPTTVGLWKAARAANDKAAQSAAEDVVRQLSRDLTRLAAEILQSFYPAEVK